MNIHKQFRAGAAARCAPACLLAMLTAITVKGACIGRWFAYPSVEPDWSDNYQVLKVLSVRVVTYGRIRLPSIGDSPSPKLFVKLKTSVITSVMATLLLAISPLSLASVELVEVFTATEQPIHKPAGIDVELYALDAPDRLQERLPKFHGNHAVQSAKAWAEANAQLMADAMMAAHAGRVKVIEYKIEKVPAIVINNTYLIYGTTDIARALHIYQHDVVNHGR